MLAKILVPLDGSDLADRVLPFVRGLAARSGAEVMLIHVIADETRSHELVLPAAHYLEAKRQSLGDATKRARHDILSGDPGGRIVAFAETYEPSLIALATHGRTGISKLLHGSVTEHVLRRSRFPVLAVNPFCVVEGRSARTLLPRRILVPLDGTAPSMSIVPIVRDLALLLDATVTLLHVVEPFTMAVPDPFGPGLGALGTELPTDSAATVLGQAERQFEASGVHVEILTRVGVVAPEICGVARDVDADLVAMATHGRNGIARYLLGSCCEEVLHLTRCPLLAVKCAETPAAI